MPHADSVVYRRRVLVRAVRLRGEPGNLLIFFLSDRPCSHVFRRSIAPRRKVQLQSRFRRHRQDDQGRGRPDALDGVETCGASLHGFKRDSDCAVQKH